MRHLLHVLRARVDDRDEGAAMALSLFLIFIIMTLSVAIAGALLVQVHPTQYAQKETRAEGAAEAGFDVALNRFRAANNGAGTGVNAYLPCTSASGTVLSGSLGSQPGSMTYAVTIRYYTTDPTGQSDSWLSSNAVACSGSAPATAPSFALLESTGDGAAVPGSNASSGSRVIRTTYAFHTNNVNILGGLVYLYNSASGWCLTTASQVIGANVQVAPCSATDIKQQWSYTTNLLLETQNAAGTLFCIKGNPNGSIAVLAACSTTDAQQLWSFNDVGRFEGAAAVNGNTNGWCLTVNSASASAFPTVTTNVVVKNECSGSYDDQHTFSPTAAVGAGKAGDATQQLVNYKYFGRCLDITGANPSATWLIGYPCKQKPSASYLLWNQKFYWDTTTSQLCTDNDNGAVPSTGCGGAAPSGDTLYCLYAGSNSTPPTAGARVLLKQCSTSDNSQKWVRNNYDTGSYSTSWIIKTKSNGLCFELNPTGASEASTYDQQWGTILVNTCDGSTKQKWNAPAGAENAALKNTYEKP